MLSITSKSLSGAWWRRPALAPSPRYDLGPWGRAGGASDKSISRARAFSLVLDPHRRPHRRVRGPQKLAHGVIRHGRATPSGTASRISTPSRRRNAPSGLEQRPAPQGARCAAGPWGRRRRPLRKRALGHSGGVRGSQGMMLCNAGTGK